MLASLSWVFPAEKAPDTAAVDEEEVDGDNEEASDEAADGDEEDADGDEDGDGNADGGMAA